MTAVDRRCVRRFCFEHLLCLAEVPVTNHEAEWYVLDQSTSSRFLLSREGDSLTSRTESIYNAKDEASPQDEKRTWTVKRVMDGGVIWALAIFSDPSQLRFTLIELGNQ
jgi:hypothetical protein